MQLAENVRKRTRIRKIRRVFTEVRKEYEALFRRANEEALRASQAEPEAAVRALQTFLECRNELAGAENEAPRSAEECRDLLLSHTARMRSLKADLDEIRAPVPLRDLVTVGERALLAAEARLERLEKAQNRPDSLHPESAAPGESEVPLGGTRPGRVLVPTELLRSLHAGLFPPEKMAVVAGRRMPTGDILLTVPFDVTGSGPETNAVHCRADTEKLRGALVLMFHTGSFLAAWFHSHPGSGLHATRPSAIDQSQYDWFCENFASDLLAAIVVRSGHIRFWPPAVGSRKPVLLGEGVTWEEEGHVCRLHDTF